MSNPIIMLAGLPGGGKSTVGAKLEERLKDYDLHSFLQVRRDLGHKRYRHKQNRNVFRELYRRTEESLKSGRGVILDNTYTTQGGRQPVYEIGKDYGVDVLVLECYCSEKEAKRRMRQRPASDGLVVEPRDPKAYDKLAQRWQDISTDLDIPANQHISYLRYNTKTNDVQEMHVRDAVRPLVDSIRQIIILVGKNTTQFLCR